MGLAARGAALVATCDLSTRQPGGHMERRWGRGRTQQRTHCQANSKKLWGQAHMTVAGRCKGVHFPHEQCNPQDHDTQVQRSAFPTRAVRPAGGPPYTHPVVLHT